MGGNTGALSIRPKVPKFRNEDRWKGNFKENMFENLAIPHKVVLFF